MATLAACGPFVVFMIRFIPQKLSLIGLSQIVSEQLSAPFISVSSGYQLESCNTTNSLHRIVQVTTSAREWIVIFYTRNIIYSLCTCKKMKRTSIKGYRTMELQRIIHTR